MTAGRPLPAIPKIKTHFWELEGKAKEKDDPELGRKEGYMFLALTVVLMIAATILISSSTDISNAKQCEIKTALDYIYLEYTPYPCKHHDIQDMAGGLMVLGIVELFWNFILFLIILRICLWQSHWTKLGFTILYVVLGIAAFIFFIATLAMFIVVRNKKADQADIDFVHLQSTMISWLKKYYTSDSLSSSDKISTGWNNFFLQYDCCAVREVLGTNNDFDNTPWCTTSGSCQSTSSQIPKTCCKSVTKDDYLSAPSGCHASVNLGTFKDSCISRLKDLSDNNIDESQLNSLFSSLLVLVILQLLETFIVLLLFALIYKHWRNAKRVQNERH